MYTALCTMYSKRKILRYSIENSKKKNCSWYRNCLITIKVAKTLCAHNKNFDFSWFWARFYEKKKKGVFSFSKFTVYDCAHFVGANYLLYCYICTCTLYDLQTAHIFMAFWNGITWCNIFCVGKRFLTTFQNSKQHDDISCFQCLTPTQFNYVVDVCNSVTDHFQGKGFIEFCRNVSYC